MADEMESCALRKPQLREENIRVVSVIPGDKQGASMLFARRQQLAVSRMGIESRFFFLESRTSVRLLARERSRLRQLVSEFKPHILHAQFGTMTAFLCATIRIPLIVTFRGSDLNHVPSMPRGREIAGKVLSQLAALRAEHIICVSRALVDRLWWARNRVSVVPTGVDTHVFFRRPKDEARRQLEWAYDDKIVLFNAGKEPAVKRLDLAKAAVEHAKAILGPLTFVVLNGETEPSLMPLLMNAADCLLLTSDHEGSPNVVKEAMACGLPVVSVDVGDVGERLKDVFPSRIVERDPIALGKALATIISEQSRSNGNDIVRRELSIDNTARAIVEVYKKVTAKQIGETARKDAKHIAALK